MSKLKGSITRHCIITPDCRRARGDQGALEEAFRQLKREYEATVDGWQGLNLQPTFHVALSVQQPERVCPHCNSTML